MKFMAESITSMMKDVAQFYFLDGPYTVDHLVNPGEPGLVKRGFKGPFKKWFNQIKITTPEIKSLIYQYAT